jgi:hypothetical protein
LFASLGSWSKKRVKEVFFYRIKSLGGALGGKSTPSTLTRTKKGAPSLKRELRRKKEKKREKKKNKKKKNRKEYRESRNQIKPRKPQVS